MSKENENPDRTYYKRDRLNPIRGFCATVQNDSNTIKAAKNTGVEAPTIRNQIRTLEGQLGVKLFERTRNNRMILTDAGKTFYNKAITILQDFDGLIKNFLDEYKDEKDKEIKIAAHYIVLAEILPKYLKILKDNEEFKELKIKLININRQEAIERLRNGKIDFAIYPVVYGEEFHRELKIKKLFKYNHVMVLQKDHPLVNRDEIKKEDFKKYTCFLMDKFTFYDPRFLLEFKENNISFENATWETFFGLAKENMGITLVTEKIFNRYNYGDGLFIKKDVDKFFPLIYYSTIERKKFTNKKAVDFLISKMEEDREG